MAESELHDSWVLGPPSGVAWVVEPDVRDASDGTPEVFGTARLDDLPAWEIDVVAQALPLGFGATSMTVRLAPGAEAPAGLTSTALKRVRVALLLESLEYHLEGRQNLLSDLSHHPEGPHLDLGDEIEMVEQVRGPGRPAHDPAALRFIAELRLSAEARHSHKPNEEIAEYLGRSTPYVTSLVGKATKAGWLGQAGSGRKRREPGPKLIRARQREAATRSTDTEDSDG